MRETTPSMMVRVTCTISRRIVSEFRTWRSTVTAKTQSKRSGGKRSRAPSPTAWTRLGPKPARRAKRRAARDMIWLGSTPTTCPRGPTQACGISSDDAGARADLQHALAATDPGKAEEAPSQTRLGGRAAARLEVADVALGLALAIDGAVGIEGARHAKCCGRISRNRARSPPSVSDGAT